MRRQVVKLLRQGRQFKTPYFNLYYKSTPFYKVGFVASRRAGKAFQRNCLKRIIRQFCSNSFNCGDFVFVLKKCVSYENREEVLFYLEKFKKKSNAETHPSSDKDL